MEQLTQIKIILILIAAINLINMIINLNWFMLC